MNTLVSRVVAFWQELRVSAVTALATLFAVRFLAVTMNLHTQLGELWRPRLDQPEWGAWFILLLFIPLLLTLHKSFGRLNSQLQNRYLVYHAFVYLIMGLFNNMVALHCYLYQLFDGRLDGEALQSLLIMDIFFQPPALFWGLCWMALSFYIAGKAGLKNWLPILWVLPFAGFTYYYNNLIIVFFLASTVAALTGFSLRSGESAKKLYLLQGILFAVILAFLAHSPIIYRSAWLSAIILMPLCWLPGYWFIRQCEESANPTGIALTWLMPVFAGGLLSQVLFNAPLAKSLFNFWFIFISFNHAAGAISLVIIALVISFIVGYPSPRRQKPIFYLITGLATIFYLADSILQYKNGMHLNLAVIDWVLSLQNSSNFISMAGTLIDWKIALAIVSVPLIVIGLQRSVAKRIASKKTIFSGVAIYLIVTAQISLMAYQILTDYPAILRDPGRNMLASLPLPEYLQDERPGINKLLQGFAECNTSFAETSEKQRAMATDSGDKKNIILIMLESTSTRYLSLFGHNEETWPELSKLKERMEIFPFIFSCFPESSNADFALMSGMYPPSYLFLRQKPDFNHPTIIEKLNKQGYDCLMYFSGFIGDTGQSSFYQPRGFAELYDAISMPDTKREDGWVWGIKEHIMVDRIDQFIEKRASNPSKPFFIYYRMSFPHSPFDRVTDDPAFFPEDDYLRGIWVNRFKNCLLYQDKQIARIIKSLDKNRLAKDTVVLAIGDHGTMLGENGFHGHGWNLEPELVNVPLVIIRPEATGFKINTHTGSHADLQPTIFELAGISDDQPAFVQGKSLLQPECASASIYLSSLTHRALIEDDHYFLFPVENSASAMVYKLTKDDPYKRFAQLSAWPAEDLWKKFGKMNLFFKLQKQLLTNIEFYDRQSAKR